MFNENESEIGIDDERSFVRAIIYIELVVRFWEYKSSFFRNLLDVACCSVHKLATRTRPMFPQYGTHVLI